MSFSFFSYFAAIALLLALLVWALRSPRRRASQSKDEAALLEQLGRRHAIYLPLIRQALSPVDIAFIASHGSAALAQRIRKERRRVVLAYLVALREDFNRLLRFAKLVAALSPEVATAQEAERLWLSTQFAWRYQMVRAVIYAGLLPQRSLDALSHMVSELAVRMETAITELGEHTAVAAKMASSLDGRGADVA
jgi:hypothetical protein